jgi:hypothetical protein
VTRRPPAAAADVIAACVHLAAAPPLPLSPPGAPHCATHVYGPARLAMPFLQQDAARRGTCCRAAAAGPDDRRRGTCGALGQFGGNCSCLRYCEFSGVFATAKGRGVGNRAGVQIA